jgi:hypothetical protein
MAECEAYKNGKTVTYNHPNKGNMVLCDENCPHENQKGFLYFHGKHGVCRTDGLVDKTEESL